jgi:predicted phosphodiesterase
MGYRFTLESANTVAKLTFGKVVSCYRDIYSSPESYYGFMSFLDQIPENMYSNEKERYIRDIRYMRERLEGERERFDRERERFDREWEKFDREWERFDSQWKRFNIEFERFERDYNSWEKYKRRRFFLECICGARLCYSNRFSLFAFDAFDALDALDDLSAFFERCAVKSLLLPKMYTDNEDNDYADQFMLSEDTFRKLIRIHEGDSCLIIQPQERPKSAIIFDAFPNFEVAIRQADLWPAVMFWDKYEGYAFVPIKHEDELLNLYEIVKREQHPINEIKRIAEGKRNPSHYIFQLSDLHFGAKNISIAKKRHRLKSLVNVAVREFSDDDSISFIITGDVMDSPTQNAANDYKEFSEFLKERSGTEPIHILGNHDINNHGLAISHGNQVLANIVGEYPKIKILDEHKVILLLFNSNTNGNFAQGEIGEEQMAKMGNLLDEIENLNDYLLIAVMHHHLLPIPNPNYYEEKWYMKILHGVFGEKLVKLLDADRFMEWLIQRNVKVVLHGHKHIPFMAKENEIWVISCGSSTGKITHKEYGKTYLSYNLIKINNRVVTCTQFAEEIIGAGAKNIRAETVRFG